MSRSRSHRWEAAKARPGSAQWATDPHRAVGVPAGRALDDTAPAGDAPGSGSRRGWDPGRVQDRPPGVLVDLLSLPRPASGATPTRSAVPLPVGCPGLTSGPSAGWRVGSEGAPWLWLPEERAKREAVGTGPWDLTLIQGSSGQADKLKDAYRSPSWLAIPL